MLGHHHHHHHQQLPILASSILLLLSSPVFGGATATASTTAASSTSTSHAQTYDVAVGKTGLTFSPDTLAHVAIGSVVNFHFWPANHSVAQSSFDAPCQPLSGGVGVSPIYSGFVATGDGSGEASTMFTMSVNSSDPIWLYCSYGHGPHGHCQEGMAMVINPIPESGMALGEYIAAAKTANVASPAEIFGGFFQANADGGDGVSPVTSTATSSGVSKTGSATSKPTAGGALSKHSRGSWVGIAVAGVGAYCGALLA